MNTRSLFFIDECKVYNDPKIDGWWLMMREPPDPDLPAGDGGMIIFTGLSKEVAEKFLERCNQAVDWWLKTKSENQ